jgi:hypothetical protein
MPQGGGAIISDSNLIYSIQRTYIINIVPKLDTFALTCNQRIDVPVIEPLEGVEAVVYDLPRTVIPCVELIIAGLSLEGLNLVFETNEGVTVLPVKIYSGRQQPWKNPYSYERWVLALPRGTTGIKSCKVPFGENGGTIQHDFTFGIMPPPYNYDNALFGFISYRVRDNSNRITALEKVTSHYGYATQKAEHTIDFSDFGDAFTIAPDTRFLTFRVTNPLETSTSMNIVLTSKSDASNNVIATCQVAPGQNNVKVDLQVLAVFIENDHTNKADSYIIPPIEDRRYRGIEFSHNRNTNLPGSVQVIEWA